MGGVTGVAGFAGNGLTAAIVAGGMAGVDT